MIQQISKDLYFIKRGWLNGNHFVFNGTRKVLIDTGYLGDLDQTTKLIEACGVELESISFIINTHCHCDHIGGNRRIREISDCGIAVHRKARELIDARDGWRTWYAFYDQEAEFFAVDISLEEGDSVYLGDLELEVIHTPGHAHGGISLYCSRERFLISADAVWDGDFGVINTIVEGDEALLQALDSLERIERLDIDTIYPGHGDVIHNPREAVWRSKSKLQSLIEDGERLGRDHLRKILLFVLLMRRGYEADEFFDYLMGTPWFGAVVDRYFEGRYQEIYYEILGEFIERGVVSVETGKYVARIPA